MMGLEYKDRVDTFFLARGATTGLSTWNALQLLWMDKEGN